MSEVNYHVVEHDGGWAYKVGDVFSETFATHDQAAAAARDAASRQMQDADATDILYQDADGRWHKDHTGPADHPHVNVDDPAV